MMPEDQTSPGPMQGARRPPQPPRARLVVLLAGALLLAGCAGPGVADPPPVLVDAPTTVPVTAFDAARTVPLAAFRASGAPAPIPPSLREGLGLTSVLVGHNGPEPNIGVTPGGSIFMTALHNTLRSGDGGLTWTVSFNLTEALPQYDCPTDVPVAGCQRLTRSYDPQLWVDPITGRVFTGHMTYRYCNNMIMSDDDGESWLMKPFTCGTPMNDAPKIATGAGYGPRFPGAAGAIYPNPVYYCYNKVVPFTGTRCAVSFDGGLHFPVETTVAGREGDNRCGGLLGHPAPHPDGTMFVPLNARCPAAAAGVSEDSGLTWTLKVSPYAHVGASEGVPEITVTPDGTAYMLWRGADQLPYLARSTDKFDTWEGPWPMGAPGLRSAIFAGLTSGDDGRIAFAYLGTRDTDASSSQAEDHTRWHLYVGASLDAGSEDPTFVVQQATPDEDPVQIGCIWLEGGSHPCRNLLDFIDMASTPDGRFLVAYAEGCIAASQHPHGAAAAGETDCAYNPAATDALSRGRHGAVAISAPLLRATAAPS